jgi:glycolate oxidase
MQAASKCVVDWPQDLTELLPGIVQTDSDILSSFSRDYAPLAESGIALAMVSARCIDDVVTTMRFANQRCIPVVTRGAGSGLAGGANAINGCIVLSVRHLNNILNIDPSTHTAIVEAGVINATLADAVLQQGLYYAPDPSSRDISTIGGNIATNAGGACCLKYGVTGDHVAALKVVLADGTLISTGAITTKNVAGLDLTRLLVGSEGTLGVIVEATLRLLKPPGPSSTLLAFFDDFSEAGAAMVAMEQHVDLSLIEIMDRTTLQAVEAMTKMGLDTSAAALVLVQSDAKDAAADIVHCEQLCLAAGARDVMRTNDVSEGKMLLNARRLALPALEKLGTTLLDDIAVPKPVIPKMLKRIEQIAQQHRLCIGTFGHAGDGNLHPTIIFDPKAGDSMQRAHLAFDDIVREAMACGGTISGEHGIGTLKRGYVRDMVGVQEQALMHRIKLAFDPNMILNPGKGF